MNQGNLDQKIIELSFQLGRVLLQRELRVTTAESCTGGGVAQAITETAGSSQWFDVGFVTYANKAKQELVGVTEASLMRDGAVSESVVCQMAEGARARASADLAVAISGIAGPDGGTPEKPVGTVWFAWADADSTKAECLQLSGGRAEVRQKAVVIALQGLLDKITV